MPALENARHEKFARNLVKGMSQEQAYTDAGYEAEPGLSAQVCASRLLSNVITVRDRVAELQAQVAARVGLDRERTTALALEDRETARSLGQMGPAVAALGLAAKVNGLIVDKSLNINADIEDLTPSELDSLRAVISGSPSVPMIDVTPQGASLVGEVAVPAPDIPEST